MNQKRRDSISKSITDIENLKKKIENVDFRDGIAEVLSNVETVLDGERDAFENLPEGLKNSFRGMESEEAIENLEKAIDLISDKLTHPEKINVADDFDEIIDCLFEITM